MEPNYTSADWFRGYEDGHSGRPSSPGCEEGTQQYVDYVDGYLTGNAEQSFEGDKK